jgi:hypothetical protein
MDKDSIHAVSYQFIKEVLQDEKTKSNPELIRAVTELLDVVIH